MHPRLLLPGLLVLFAATACSDSGPASPAPSPGAGETITGRERFGWVQAAGDYTELTTYRYAVYIDGSRRALEGETCATVATALGFECSAPLPPLSAGFHTLELAAFVTSNGEVIESPRSAPLQVRVAGATAPADIAAGRITSSDGLQLDATILYRSLADPVDLAAAVDGRVFVAEREGGVRILAATNASRRVDSADNVLLALRETEGAILQSIALAHDFSRTGLLYVAYLTTHPEVRIARFREAGGLLGQAAVISSHRVPPESSALIRVGPDRHLYVAFGTGTDPGEAQKPAAAAGKILRLREDGATPDDNPYNSLVWSVGHANPRGLVWHTPSNALWSIEPGEEGAELNAIRPGANYGWPVVKGLQRHPAVTPPSLVLPAGIEPSGLATIGLSSSAVFGDLFVSTRDGEDVLRLRVDGNGRALLAGGLLAGRFGGIANLTSGTDGALYLVTGNRDTFGAGNDLLIRLMPMPSPESATP